MDAQYYKERLGFEPVNGNKNGHTPNGQHKLGNTSENNEGYEENLCKIKDERDAIQKKTFTKWVNKHLKKCGRHVRNLFVDLRDGKSLLGLLEVLSEERLPSQKGQLRFHQLQNVQVALDFLRFRKIKLVNIRAEDIVDGNPKLTLGLIWTIILHFQISDIVDGDDTVNVREALLRWAQKTTERYPGVRVSNFTSSWRDGLAFSAIIHRNRPDLIDWREVQQKTVQSRLDQAFHIVEQEYGVTKLLDPEDVDTNEPDEKSLITYVSSLYDIFPDPPTAHPLYDAAAEKSLDDYRQSARRLHEWIRKETTRWQQQSVSSTSTAELRQSLKESERFHSQQLPPKHDEKQRLVQQYMQLERSFHDVGKMNLEPELHVSLLERNWSQLVSIHQQFHRHCEDELTKQERLQKLADKIQHEIRTADRRLDTIKEHVDEEAHRVTKSRPRDVKQQCEKIDTELVRVEETIKVLFSDVSTLQEGRHPQAPALHRDVQQLHTKWMSVHTHMQDTLIAPLSKRLNENPDDMLKRLIESDENFRFLSECLDWVKEKLVHIHEAEYGHDLHSCQEELEVHHKEHKIIDQFQVNLDRCVTARKEYDDDELTLYMRLLSQLQKSYADLLSSSNKRLSDLMILHDFVQGATAELIWLNEKEEVEVGRDWSNRNQDLRQVDAHYEQLMSELERRERQFTAVQEQGMSLISQQHPASKTVEAYMGAMQTQWSWLLQLTLCLETHLKHAQMASQLFQDVDAMSHTIKQQDERLNGEFSVSEFTLDEGEQLLREMQELRDVMAQQGDVIQQLETRANQVTPQKQRRQATPTGQKVTAVCNYKNNNVSVRKQDDCTLLDNSSPDRWTVRTPAGVEAAVPSVCFLLPPPDREALEAVEQLKRQYEMSVTLWQRKQLRMRQNMIFATIKVVKGWDLQQFVAMGSEQRDAIRRALNEDAEKLIREGDPNDGQLRRLRREIDEVNRLFDEFERLAAEASPTNQFHTKIAALETEFEKAEGELKELCVAPIPREITETERLIRNHKDWQNRLQRHESTLEEVQSIYDSLSKKTPTMQSKLEKVIGKWDSLWTTSHSYIERLKCVEATLGGLEETQTVVSRLETRLNDYRQLPDDKDGLKSAHLELVDLQNSLHKTQVMVEQLNEDALKMRKLTERTRPRQRNHADVERLEEDVSRVTKRFTNCCQQVVDRLRAVDQAADLLSQYEQKEMMNRQWALQMEADAERARKAVVEKYKQCGTSIAKLLTWIAEVERRLANQEQVQEDVSSLRNQINVVKAIKDELKDEQRTVSTALDQVQDVVEKGNDILSKDEIKQLQTNAQELRQRYDTVSDHTDVLLRRLSLCLDELNKYKTDLHTFQSWLSIAERTLAEKERHMADLSKLKASEQGCREFVNDVIAHQADLRFITVAAQRFIDESKSFLKTLNDVRTNLPQRLRHIEPHKYNVKLEVDQVTKVFQSLLARGHQLLDRLTALAGRQRDYEEALERAARWLREIEPRAQQLLEEPVASEPRQVQEQLSRARLLSTDLLSNGKLMEAAGASAEQLVRQLSEGGHQLSARQQQQIQRPPAELTERHGRLRDTVDARCQALDAALVQSQGVHDSLDSLNGWLQEAEARLKALLKPASLVRQRLSEQQHEQRLLQADIDQHRSSVDKLRSAAAQMTPGGGRHGGVGTSLQDAAARFDRLQAACKDRGRFLQELAGQVDDFWTRAEGVQHWLLQQIELIDSQEVGMLNGDAYQKRIEEVGGQRDAKKSELQAVVGAGNGLVSKKDTTDSSMTRDKVKELEGLWRELEEVLGERLREGRTRSDSLSAYERMKEDVLRWLQRMESRIDGLEPVAVDMAILKRQGDEIKPLLKEHDSFAASIDKFNELGVQYDGLLHGDRVDGPSRRRISVTPKRSMSHGRRSVTSTLSPARKGSQERRGGSPGGSPFTTRRDPDAYTKLDDVSQIQNQLNEVSHRYELAGARLTDRQRDIDAVSDELRRQLDQLRQLQQLLDKAGWREQLPATRDEADRQLRAVRQQLEDFMYEKQPLMDGLRGQTVELLRRHPGAPGAEALQKTIDELSQRWKQRLDQLKTAQQTLQDCREFFDLHEQLGGWLQAKEKMFAVLGPLSADPRLVHMQSQQVAVLRDEFANQHPTLQALNRCGKTVVTAAARDDPAAKKVEEKVRKTNDKWEELMAMLEDREQNLDAASGASRQFNESFSKLQRDLMRLGDAFDDMSTDRLEPHKKLQLLDDLQKQLDQLRPRLSELEALGEELCLVLTDPAAKTEVKDKLYQLGRQYNQLAKKMDYLRAELDSSLKEDQEFENSCADVQDWMKACFNQLAKPLKVSADRTKLTRQLNEYEPFYKSIMAREHEVFLLQRKGSDLLAKTPNKQESKELEKFLDHLQKNWEALKQDAVGRLTQLQTCMDLCKKYHSTHDHFLPWLKKAEDKLQKLPAVSFKKADIQKQVRDLQTFRNEVSLHSSEYEQTVTTGDSLLQATDLDKTEVQSDLQKLRQRWEALGSGLTARHQALDDVLARVADFSDGLQDLEHGLQRCEDKLTSQDGSRDPRALERCDELLGEADKLTGQLQRLRKQADDLCGDARRMGSNADHLRDEVDRAGKRLNKFKDRLDSRHAELSGASQAVGEMNERVKRLYSKLAELEEELDGMGPVARTVKIVEKQVTEITYFMEKVVHEKDELDQAERSVDNLAQEGFTQDDRTLRNQLGSMRRQLSRIDDRGQNRQREVNLVLTKLTTFYRTYELVIDDIEQVSRDEADFPPLGSDVTTIRRQQQQFKEFKSSRVETLSVRVDDCNRSGQGLIQSASTGVTTAVLEGDLESMNQLWNELQERIHNRERALDVGLLQSGKFREALEGLLQWLADTEDMVAHQKPASADYKVVKAQVQEQKFLRKLLLDRQGSVSSLAEMGREIAANCSPAERADIDGQLTELIDRFDALNGQADERMRQLEDAMKVAKEYQDMNGPLVEWLEKMEKRLKDMEIVPTDEEKIQKRIKEHEALHDGIVGRRGEFDQLADVATVLMELVGDDEAAALADRLQQVTDRYQKLVADSDALARLLRDAGHQLRTLVLNYEDFLVWMDEMEQRLNKYRVLSVHVDKLHEQMEELTDLSEEVDHHRGAEQDLQDVGAELMKHITNEEALQLKDKLDSVSHRYSDLETKAASLLKNAQEVLPLVHSFHSAHNKLSDWLVTAEQTLQSADSMPNIDETMEHLMQEVQDYRPVVERLNQVGPQLCQVSPGEGAQTIEGLLVRDNRRYESIVEQVQRKSERLRLAKLKNSEVLHDIDDLLDWFKEVETQVREADPPSSDPDVIRIQLKEHKALNDDVASQKGRVRDVLSSAKRLIRDAGHQDDVSDIREKSDDLKDVVDSVSKLSSDRLSRLEQALPLAEHFFDAHHQLTEWLDEAESEAMRADLPALRADQILRQQERNKALLQGLQEHKPLLDKLNKTSAALVRLCSSDEAAKVSEITETDNVRYNALRTSLRERQQALEEALQECSQFSDKLDSMLTALKDTADQVNKAEPISVHPDRIQDQMAENNAIIDDLEKRESALKAVRKAADDVIHKAGDSSDPAVRDIKNKLDSLNKLWNHLQKATDDRGRSLDEALAIAEKFWSELHSVMKALKDLQDTLTGQEPPAVEPDVIKDQQQELQEIRHEIDQTKPEVEQVRRTGQHLMKVCGEPEKPEVRKNLADLGSAWDNITALYARREENLIDAMEKAMEFHDTMQRLLEFLESAEQRLDRLGPIGSDIDAVKKQIKQLMDFKNEVDPQMVKVETLNRQAHELMERTSPDQAAALRRPISEVNTRWDDLLKGLVERQRELDQALLRLGQFQHALDELLVWIGRTDKTLDSLKPNFGDPQLIEVELAKLKVTVNDMQAHQTSVDTLNDAGRQLIEADRDSVDAGTTHRKLNELNDHWQQLQEKAVGKQQALEKVLRDAHDFMTEIQDLLFWLNDLDGALTTSKPVGGLPETAKEQLERFMELFTELEDNRAKVNAVLSQGDVYLKSAKEGACTNMKHNLKTLKQRWDHVMNRANDKKIKLEIALKEATEFQDTLEQFIEWLNSAEKTLSAMQPVSRIMDNVIKQIDEHKDFQKAVSAHRECMLNLEKKGNHLKYFSQKQDVILIKNMLVSVQHRWERVVSKSADRTRALDVGYKEAKEFDDSWCELCGWLDEALHSLDDTEQSMSNNPDKVRVLLEKHKEFQGALGSRQSNYDAVMKLGRLLIKEKAPKVEEPLLREMLDALKDKWNSCCNKSVARQRKLEEALLFSGQFKEALAALLDWLRRAHGDLKDDVPVHGDLDTVSALCEHQKAFEQELEARVQQVESVQKTGAELARKADKRDSDAINAQVSELTDLWTSVVGLSDQRGGRLKSALRDAERLHKAVHMLLEWLSDAEMRLRFVGALPESEDAALQQAEEHARFMQELSAKETDKDSTLDLAGEILSKAHPDAVPVIRHWQTIIQSRWEEVSSWALQRQARLDDHVTGLKDLQQLLDELVRWVRVREQKLVDLEPVPLPDDLQSIELLVQEHQEFMEDLQSRQNEVDRICRPKHRSMRKSSRPKSQSSPDREMTPGKRSGETPDGDPQREYDKPWLSNVRATSPGRERSPDSQWARIGPVFSDMPAPGAGSRKGSRMSVSEPLSKSPLHRELWDAWRGAWMLAWERQRRLQDKLSYARELDKLQNFDFEEWRKRFMKYANQKKLRITDLFRRMDTDNDGFLEKFEFSDGIIKTNFPTSKLEMQMVADLVDRNQDGLIDYNEFMSALKPDWEKNRPLTDAEKIDDEVQKACSACTCRSKFKVFQVGEGKYRFGDSQKLRLVRILRSTVMVRVGGGWEALDEFLVKNDPCRAKGRTNVELREQFILAPGVSQSMAHFKSKRDASSPASRSTSVPTAGPITKVREKTGRSIPLSRASVSGGGDYGSSTEGRSTGGGGFSLRKGSTPARSSSSQGGSRPPSRAGSEISLDSVDGRPTAGYQQRNASGSSRLPTYRKGSTTPRGLATTPVSLSGRSPSSDGFSMQRRMPRRPASVTAMSSGSTAASRSRIPLLTRADTSDSIQPPSSRATTPAGRPRLHRTSSTQSIPASLNNTRRVREPSSSKIVRRSSGAADTARGQARKSATTERPRWH